MKRTFVLSMLAIFFVGCGASSSADGLDASFETMSKNEKLNEGESALESSAVYEFTFTSLWTSADHLGLPGNAHFSPLVVNVHNEEHTLVRLGGIAGPGLELVSELGRTNVIERELRGESSILSTLITENQFLRDSLTQVRRIDVNKDFSKVSLVSMIAPSPDWIVAVDSLELYDGNEFISDSGEIMLFAYNAGTENGDTGGNFSINNSETNPKRPISMLKGRGFEKPFAMIRFVRVK